MTLSTPNPEFSEPAQRQHWLDELANHYTWQFQDQPSIDVPASWLPILVPLFEHVQQRVVDELEQMMFSWTTIKVHQGKLAVYYISTEEDDQELDALIAELAQQCQASASDA